MFSWGKVIPTSGVTQDADAQGKWFVRPVYVIDADPLSEMDAQTEVQEALDEYAAGCEDLQVPIGGGPNAASQFVGLVLITARC